MKATYRMFALLILSLPTTVFASTTTNCVSEGEFFVQGALNAKGKSNALVGPSTGKKTPGTRAGAGESSSFEEIDVEVHTESGDYQILCRFNNESGCGCDSSSITPLE